MNNNINIKEELLIRKAILQALSNLSFEEIIPTKEEVDDVTKKIRRKIRKEGVRNGREMEWLFR